MIPGQKIRGMKMKKIEKKMPYHLQAYEILKQQILSGALAPGEKISDNKLAQEIGVSRSPVREALRMLEQDELIISTDSGLMVNPLDPDRLREIYQCRIALESYAAGLAAANITDKHVKTLENSIAQSRAFHKAGEYDKVQKANAIFHNTVINLCGNSSLIKLIDRYSALINLTKTEIFEKLRRGEEPYLSEHEEMVKALQEHDSALVESLMRKHIHGDYLTHLSLLKQRLDKDVKEGE